MEQHQPITLGKEVFNTWKGQTKAPKIDLVVFLAKLALTSAATAWAIRKAPLSSRQIMLIPPGIGVVAALAITSCSQDLFNDTGLFIEPIVSLFLVTGAYGLGRAGGLVPRCFQAFRWTPLLDTLYHGGAGAAWLCFGASGVYNLSSEALSGKGIGLWEPDRNWNLNS